MPSLLSVNNYYYPRGGAETVFLSHNRMFEDLHWQVVPFAMQHPRNLETAWARYFVEEIEFGARYSWLGRLRRAPKTIYSLEAHSNVKALLREHHFDICHAHNIYHHISPSILSAVKAKGIPVVMTLHDLKIVCPAYNMLASDGVCERCKGGKVYNVLLQRCIKNSLALSALVMVEAYLHRILRTYERQVDRFVVPSRFYIDKLVEWGWERARFVHIPNFIDVTQYQPEFEPGGPFLYFGRLSREKGLSTLIRAAARANVPVTIVGTGPDEAALRELACQAGVNVEFLGFQSGAALHDAVRSARAVVLPSEWYENAPMSVIEAYALGKPVLGADIGGIPELVRVGETGFTFASGSIDELADLLNKVSSLDDSQLSAMGRSGHAWVESDYSQERYRERMLALYESLGVGL